jgi:hypothetical protein
MGFAPSQFIKERSRANSRGIRVKIAKPIKFGAINV